MIALRLQFLNGRYHATPWGRHVNEGVAEWPPSPYRLLRALADVGFRKHGHWSESRLGCLLRALASQLPHFCLPATTRSHTRGFLPQNDLDRAARQKILDAFVVVGDQPVWLVWPELVLESALQLDLQELVRSVHFLGRSESWVEISLQSDPPAPCNCSPQPDSGQPVVLVACPELSGPADSWLERLCQTSLTTQRQGWSRPPAQALVEYSRPFAELEALAPLESPCPGGLLYQIDGPARPRRKDLLQVARRFRLAAMSQHRHRVGASHISWRFHGRAGDGKPRRGHGHAYFLPMDLDGDGRLDHLLVHCRSGFSASEREALDAIGRVSQPHHPDIHCLAISLGELGADCCWESQTPFVPVHHYKPCRGPYDEWLKQQLLFELGRCGYPLPHKIEFLDGAWEQFGGSHRARGAAGFRLHFDCPVSGPIVTGHGCHYGLGLFLPPDFWGKWQPRLSSSSGPIEVAALSQDGEQ